MSVALRDIQTSGVANTPGSGPEARYHASNKPKQAVMNLLELDPLLLTCKHDSALPAHPHRLSGQAHAASPNRNPRSPKDKALLLKNSQ